MASHAAERGPWRPVRTADGSWTLAHEVHGEACHSLDGAWTEACERYAAPCLLAQRARCAGDVSLLDVGTGLGWNLAAALAATERAGARLLAVSLERDPRVIAAALDLEDLGDRIWGPARAETSAALRRALADPGRAASPAGIALGRRGRLRLLVGDARATVEEVASGSRFDAVFLDAFSPRVEPDLWELPFLRAVASRMSPAGVLSTFSASFAVRLSLARAGLRVGRGPRVGSKREGTLASPDRDLPELSPRQARRLERALAAACPDAGRIPGFLGAPRRDRAPGID